MFNSIKRRVVDLTVMHMVVRGPENICCPESGFLKTNLLVKTLIFFIPIHEKRAKKINSISIFLLYLLNV